MICTACNNTGKEADGAAHTCTVCNGESAKPSESSGKPERPVKRNGYPDSSNHRSFNEGFNSACDKWAGYAADLETELRVTKQALESLKGECEDLRNAALTQYAKKAELAEQNSGVHCTGHVDYDPSRATVWQYRERWVGDPAGGGPKGWTRWKSCDEAMYMEIMQSPLKAAWGRNWEREARALKEV